MDFIKLSFKTFIFLLGLSFLFPQGVTAQEEEDEGFTFGGAVRYNVISTSYESDPTALSTSATWDTWRLNVDGSKAGVDLSFEYRWYPTFGTHFIHHGYLGYGFNDKVYMKLGVSQVPFGITKYASHSWWFQGPYYVGLEDDYDMGLKFDITPSDNFKLSLGYFRQAEPEGPIYGGDVTFGNAGAGRYSYDIVPGMGYTEDGDYVSASVRELNQFNIRAALNITEDIEVGVSGQFGGNYNSVLDESETSMAFGGHLLADFGNFNFKGEYIHYDYAAKDDNGDDLAILNMGAYGFGYPVASKANMYVAGLAYSVPVKMGPISNIQFYVDYTMIDKTNEDYVDTHHLIPGFLITAGSIYTYVDFALGKNQPWLTENFGVGLGQGRTYSNDVADEGKFFYTEDLNKVGQPVPVEEIDWNLRFNINIGYYF